MFSLEGLDETNSEVSQTFFFKPFDAFGSLKNRPDYSTICPFTVFKSLETGLFRTYLQENRPLSKTPSLGVPRWKLLF